MHAEAKVIVSQRYNSVKLKPDQIARFWSKVDKDSSLNGCWLWQGFLNPRGYGIVCINHLNYVSHRMAFVMKNGPIPEKMLCCHRCDNPSCVNPDHIFLGSHADNNLDSCLKMRHTHGERHSLAKLKDHQVLEIRELCKQSKWNKHISIMYGVSHQVISHIRNGRSWKHLLAHKSSPSEEGLVL